MQEARGVLLEFASNETTRNRIAGEMHAMSLYPDQKETSTQEAGLLPGAAETTAGYPSPALSRRPRAAGLRDGGVTGWS
jgi:cytochrome P450